jgi:hypothetical protein
MWLKITTATTTITITTTTRKKSTTTTIKTKTGLSLYGLLLTYIIVLLQFNLNKCG